MSPLAALPRDLRIVALLFLLGGINSVLTMIVGAMTNHISLDFGVLGILAYFGLLRLSWGWRVYALVAIWFEIVFFPVVGIVVLTTNHCTFNLFTVPVAQIPAPVGVMFFLFFFLLALWQLKVLTRHEVWALFQRDRA
jgi:hypothetical protein